MVRPQRIHGSRRREQLPQSGSPANVRAQAAFDLPQPEQVVSLDRREQFSQRGASVNAKWQGLRWPQMEQVAL
jgi:hypothetical protein